MVTLPNGARRSDFAVFPDTWKTKSAFDPDVHWYFTYRYYDSENKVKQVKVKGVNKLTSWQDRKKVMEDLLLQEANLLRDGLNPFTKTIPSAGNHIINPYTPVLQALSQVKLNIGKRTKKEIDIMLPHINKAAQQLRIADLPIQDIRKRHIKAILEHCSKKSDRWTANTFNHYRTYLHILFKELSEMEAIELNPVKEIAKQKIIKRIRQTLTPEERRKVSDHLQRTQPRFWLFTQIFFHSGARESELLRLKGKDVSLRQQSFKITVIKGSDRREVNKTIKDIALEYWHLALNECKPGDYVFSKDLRPGPVAIDPSQITRRWNRHVKKKLGITADFYSLKHSHTTEVVELLGEAEAAQVNSHTSQAMVRSIYDVNSEERQKRRIKGLSNKF